MLHLVTWDNTIAVPVNVLLKTKSFLKPSTSLCSQFDPVFNIWHSIRIIITNHPILPFTIDILEKYTLTLLRFTS